MPGKGLPGGSPMLGLEIRKPNRQTVVGFIIAWIVVIFVMLLTMFIARIGA